MANPQAENGYTKIANEILDALAKTKLNGTQRRILDVVFRYTYGFNRKSHNLSLTFIAEATNLDKSQVKREFNKLIDLELIKVFKEASFNNTRVVGINKDYEQWGIKDIQGANSPTGSEKDYTQGANSPTPQGANPPTKKESIKENIKEKDFESVFNFYLTLNLKKHRAYTNDMKKAINKAVKNNKYSTEYCKTLLERHKQVIDITKQHEFPVRARGFAEFFGQKVYGATHLICSEYEEGGKYYEQYLKEEPKTKVDIRVGVPQK